MIIGISGHKQSGKNTLARLLNIMLTFPKYTNKEIKDHQAKLESMYDSLKPVLNEIEEIQDEIMEKQSQLNDIEDKIDVIKSMNELSDADQNKILKLIDEKQGIRKEIKKLRKEVKEIDNNQTQTIKDLEEQIPINTAELVSKMVYISPEEYLEKSTEFDDIIVQNLSTIKLKLLSGDKAKDIEKYIKKQIDLKTKDTSFQ